MQRSLYGYSIIEVTIVLAISGLLLLSVIGLFRGQQAKTEFSQAVQDVESKIQSYVNQATTSQFSGTEGYKCSTATGRPVLERIPEDQPPPGQGTSEECLFLGRSIVVRPDTSLLSIYTVLGNSTKKISDGTIEPVVIFDEAKPTPIMDEVLDGANLTEEYEIAQRGAIVKWSETQVQGRNDPQKMDMVGFYTALQGGSRAILVKGYDFKNADYNDEADRLQAIRDCITQEGACQNFPVEVWQVCFASTQGNQTALLSIIPTQSGATTRIRDIIC